MRYLLALPGILLAVAGAALGGGPSGDPAHETGVPHVESIEPTGQDVEVEVERIVVEFSEAMNTSLDDVAQLRHGEEVVADHGTWNAAGTNLTLELAEHLEYNTTYTVFVNTTATNATGTLLDGDGDGIQEGADDVHEATFHTARPPPIPTQPAPLNPWIVLGIVLVTLLVIYAAVRLRPD